MLVVAASTYTMSKPVFPEAITIKMASGILDVGEKSIRRWIRMGYIRAYRIGPYRLVRIPRTEIARMRRIRREAAVEDERPRYPVVD